MARAPMVQVAYRDFWRGEARLGMAWHGVGTNGAMVAYPRFMAGLGRAWRGKAGQGEGTNGAFQFIKSNAKGGQDDRAKTI